MNNLENKDNTDDAYDQKRFEESQYDEAYIELETDNLAESLVRNVVKGYQEAWNKTNEKNEIKFSMTITNHKVATPDGNKAVAYLRIDRAIREKGPPKLIEQEGKPPIVDEGWESKLLHQEVYFFKGIKEQIDPRAMWKEQLYVNALARLVSAGLEYAELLQRLKPAKEAMQQSKDETERKMDNLGLVKATAMPAPVDEKYVEWVKSNSEHGK